MLYPHIVDELVECFNVAKGYSDAPKAMAYELIQANLKIMDLERQLRREERKVSAGYVRRDPGHRARKPKPERPYIGDEWIKTGSGGDAS